MTSASIRETMPITEHGTVGSALSIRGLRRTFVRRDGQHVTAINGVDLEVAAGEVVVLLGPSGCGKTTLLRAVAGLEVPDSGQIALGGRTVFDADGRKVLNVPTEKRHLSMMFQSYALWPHMTVFDNVSYPLRMRHAPRAGIRERVEAALQRADIAQLGREYPQQLSGGQQQRVALARAIVDESPIILFDEPLSNVDAKVRTELRLQLIALQQRLGYAGLYVTHDQVEAMEVGHRIAVMEAGRIAQIGAAAEIYDRPATRYVANFIGAVNELTGALASVGPDATVDTPLGRFAVARDSLWEGLSVGDEVVVIFRPESARIVDATTTGENLVHGTVVRALYAGTHAEVFVRVADRELRVWAGTESFPQAGEQVAVSVPHERVRLVPEGSA